MKNLATTVDKRPAKKLPEKAAEMNPIMLLNQMRPNAVYEDAGTVGLPPNVHFTVNCTVGDEVFHGSASTKKVARRLAAFAACTKVKRNSNCCVPNFNLRIKLNRYWKSNILSSFWRPTVPLSPIPRPSPCRLSKQP